MTFTIDRDTLLNNLTILQKGLPNKTPLPILTAIKFDINEDHLLLTSSNTDIAIQVFVDDKSLNVVKAGKVAILGRYLIEIVRKVNAQKVEFQLVDDNLIIIRADQIGRASCRERV